MRVFKSNTTRIVIACFIIFMAIPFIFVESSDGVRGKGPSIPVDQSTNPLTKIIDRIGQFYGFKKSPARSSFKKDSQQLASAKMSTEKRALDSAATSPSTSGEEAIDFGDVANVSAGASAGPVVSAGKLPQVKEYIRMDGDTFEVVTDPQGRKFVAMPDGFVPYEQLMSDTISQEEFDAARILMPNAEDWEVFEALRSPGGVPAYIASGGNNVFSRGNTPGYYDRNGKEGSRLFGMGSSGRGGAGDDIYDDRKLDESIAGNRGRVSGGGGSRGGSGISSGMRDKFDSVKNKENVNVNVSGLIRSGVIIGNEIIKVQVKDNDNVFAKGGNQGNVFSPNPASAAGKSFTEILKLREDKTNKYMSSVMPIPLPPQLDENGNEIGGIWSYPDKIENGLPGDTFSKANGIDKPANKGFFEQFAASDNVYSTNMKAIQNLRAKKIPGLKMAIVDGVENGQIKAVNKDTFHYKVISGLIDGRDISSNGIINITPANQKDTLFVVSDIDSLQNLKGAGYNAVMFNQYAITPEDTIAFYNGAKDEIEDMARAKQDEKTTKQDMIAKTNDITNARVGVRGLP